MNMETTPSLPLLIYDGDCAFCSSSIRFIQKVLRRPPNMEPFQFIDTKAFGLTKNECSEEIKFVDADGQVYGGEKAYQMLLKRDGGLLAALGSLLRLPGITQVMGVVYRWVAKNRHSLPGGTPTCSLPRTYNDD